MKDYVRRYWKCSAVWHCLAAAFCGAVQAFGTYNIHAVAGITEGGVLGALLLLRHWLHISPAVSSVILNAGCYLFGLKTFGKSFLIYSFFSVCGYSVGYSVCEQFPPLWPGIAAHSLLAAVLGSLFIGVGSGVCVRIGGATSGDDALAMSLSARTRIGIQWIYLGSDLLVLLLSLSYIPLSRIAYSLLTVILSGQIIGWIQKAPKP